MKSTLLTFSGSTLSSEQMKMVKGGRGYCCECKNGPGTWFANYSTASAAGNAIRTYCSGSGGAGTCYPM